MTDAELDAIAKEINCRLCEQCWEREWSPGGTSGYESSELRVCQRCYYGPMPAEAVRHSQHRSLIRALRRRLEHSPRLIREVRGLNDLLADLALDSRAAAKARGYHNDLRDIHDVLRPKMTDGSLAHEGVDPDEVLWEVLAIVEVALGLDGARGRAGRPA